jgi:hypothetical protein
MGFLDRILGRKKSPGPPGGSGHGGSLAGALAQQNETLSSRSCDKCGATYLSSDAGICLLSAELPELRLDIGGYCPRCHKHLCQRHLAFAKVEPSHLPDPGKIRDMSYGVVCETCGTQVRHDRNAGPERFVTIITLDAKDLEPSRPRPSEHVAAPSGKFSLHKILEATLKPADPDLDAVPDMICVRCFAFHPHPVPAPVFAFDAFRKSGYEVTPADFEVDIGGNCSDCGGAICAKHITLREVTVEGSKCLALFCSTHGTQLQ